MNNYQILGTNVSEIGSLHDETGENQVIYYSIEELVDQDWVSKYFASEHCTHEYDCCGNWYPSTGKIVGRDGETTIVSQILSMNI